MWLPRVPRPWNHWTTEQWASAGRYFCSTCPIFLSKHLPLTHWVWYDDHLSALFQNNPRFSEETDITVQCLSKKHLRFSFPWASTLAGSYFGLFSTFFSSTSFEKAQTGTLGKFTGTRIPASCSNPAWVGNANSDSYLLTDFKVVTTTGLAISDFQVVPRTQQSCVLIFSNSFIIHVEIRH